MSDAATPRAAKRRSVAFFAGAFAALVSCAEPTRPTFPGTAQNDTIPPEIQVIAPPTADSVIASGSSVTISVAVRDPSTVTAVTCDVTGVASFSFPAVMPGDTTADITFPVPTRAGSTGRLEVEVVATDAAGNTGSKTLTFLVR